MGRMKHIATAAALALSIGVHGSVLAQDIDPAALDPATSSNIDAGGVTQEEAIAVTPDDPDMVQSELGGLANAGTMSDAALGQPLGGTNIQPQVTELGQRANDFNTALLVIMTIVTIFVFALLFWAMLRFRKKANPVPSKTTHNVLIEVLWTIVPVFILVGIAVPSFGLLLDQYDPPEADVTVKAIGHQWYWEYEYPDQGNFGFDSIMLSDDEIAAQPEVGREPRLLAVDNRVIVPVGATVKMLITSVDVLHSWAMPAFWVKMDAVPGKINETWFKAEKTGVFYGQCSELCGTKHGFMPIAVEVVTQAQFDGWVAARQADAGIDPADLIETAEADSPATTDEEGDLAATTSGTGAGTEGDDLTATTTAAPEGTVIEQSNRDSGVATSN
ncbi:MAG: cytochrome c oxidase subunit II [Pacificimonas sp.]